MNQLTPREPPERATGITIECTPDATAVITWHPLKYSGNIQYVVHVNGEQVYLFEARGPHQTTVPAVNGDWVKAGIFQLDHPYISTEVTCNAMQEVADTTTTTTTAPPEIGPVTTVVAETTQPATLPHTGPADYQPELFGIATVMLLAGVTLASRKEKR